MRRSSSECLASSSVLSRICSLFLRSPRCSYEYPRCSYECPRCSCGSLGVLADALGVLENYLTVLLDDRFDHLEAERQFSTHFVHALHELLLRGEDCFDRGAVLLLNRLQKNRLPTGGSSTRSTSPSAFFWADTMPRCT